MSTTELKTKKNATSVPTFIASIGDPEKRADAKTLANLMSEATGEKAVMWGPAMVGFGQYRYARADKSEHEYFAVGFSPRKQALTVYVLAGFKDYGALLKKLGPYKSGGSCLYLKRLKDAHLPTLKTLIARGYKDLKKRSIAKT